ncbi:MAG: penicillin-binding protein 2 [Chloroflexota bacterium]|nr:MAG: penicillin-binding protein 2 [Chloroflexota bacterium]
MVGDSSAVRWRVIAVAVLMAGFWLALAAQTGNVQIYQHDIYREKAEDEHWGKRKIVPRRAAIKDTNGYPLAMTVNVFNVIIDAGTQLDRGQMEDLANQLGPLIGEQPAKVMALLEPRDKTKPLLLKDALSYEIGTKIADLGIRGVRLEREPKRTYPEGSLAAQLIGFVGEDDKGLVGLESDFNEVMAGKFGTILYEQDTAGDEIPLGVSEEQPAEEGSDLILTIDRRIQRVLERELEAAMAKSKPTSASMIVLDPKTGAILGIASRPTYDLTKLDLNDPNQMALYRNPLVTDLYEPGSTFKVVAMAAGLDSGKVRPQDTINCKGVVYKYGVPIYMWDRTSRGIEDMTDVLMNSCNIGMVWVGDQLGSDLFYSKAIDAFGFGKSTGIGLEGEATGQIRRPGNSTWGPLDLSTGSFGQGFNATPLQLVSAVAAIANDGKLMRPYVVRQMVGPKGVQTVEPVVRNQAITTQTARTLTQMMYNAQEKAPGNQALVPGYKIAGKSGTAEKPVAGGYSSSTIASYIGFGPVENPRFLLLVKVEDPKDSEWGGQVAAPIFSKVARQIFNIMGVPPSRPVPDPTPRGTR